MRSITLGVLLLSTSLFASAAGRTVDLDKAHSQVDVAVKATVDSFTAHLTAFDAAIVVDETSPRPLSAEFRFQFANLKTGKEGRDTEMLHWEDTTKYPVGVFTLKTISPLEGSRYTAQGTLQFHGVLREISFPVSIKSDAERWSIDGDAPLDTREYGLPVIRKFAVMKVAPVVGVHFHLQGTLRNSSVATTP